MKKIIVLSFCFLCNLSWAQTINGVPSVKKITAEVAKAADRYARSISCMDEPILAKNIFALTPAKITNEDGLIGEGEYLVFWFGDIGCNFGNKTATQNFAFVEVSATNAVFFVDPLKSSPAVDIPINGFIEQIVGTHGKKVVIDVAEFVDNDSNCCPSKKSRNTYRLEDSGKWTLIKRDKRN